VREALLIVAVAVLLAAVVAFAPWVLFWAIGALFDFHIAVTVKTWFAAWALMLLVGPSPSGSKS
jgi:hypothetical protein